MLLFLVYWVYEIPRRTRRIINKFKKTKDYIYPEHFEDIEEVYIQRGKLLIDGLLKLLKSKRFSKKMHNIMNGISENTCGDIEYSF